MANMGKLPEQDVTMNKSVVAAAAILLVLALWMLSGMLPASSKDKPENNDTNTEPQSATSDSGPSSDTKLMKVQVVETTAEQRTREVTLQGQLDPLRRLEVVAQTGGSVESIPVTKGSRVKQGDVLVKLGLDTKETDLAEANALLSAARAEQKAASRLQQRGLQSELALQQANARLASARAARDRISLQITHTQITAPFDAIINNIPVDQGELVERGMMVADLIDDSAFVITASASQQTVSQISNGQKVRAKLITGEELQGKITFLSAVADPLSRSFTIEARLDKTNTDLVSGVSASLLIPVESLAAVQISASAIALGDDGEIGVKTVDAEDRVEFYPVTIVSSDTDGAWVTGIPAGSRVITLGQGFVNVGEQVEPVLEPASESTENPAQSL